MSWWLRHLFLCLSLSLYATMAPFGYLAFAILSLAKPGDERFRARLVQGIVHRAFGLMHHWLRFTRLLEFDPRRVRKLLPAGPFIIIANHPSLTDTTAIIASVPQVCAIVRGDIYEKKLVRPLLEVAGYLNAGDRGAQEVASWMAAAQGRLRDGFSLLIFPEGTRSPVGKPLRHFGRLAFEASCQFGVPVLALTVHETPRWLGRGTGFFPIPAVVPRKELAVLKVYKPEDFQGNSRKMRRTVEEDYKSALSQAPGGTPPQALAAAN